MPLYRGLLEPTGPKLTLLKPMFNPENVIHAKFTKTRYFGVQGRSRSSTLAPLEISSAVLV